MRLKLVLSSRQTLHQVKKPPSFTNSATLARWSSRLWINVVSIFQKGYKLQPRVKEIIVRQNVMKPWPNFIRRKQGKRKGDKGQGPKVQSRQAKQPNKGGPKCCFSNPPHAHTHKYRKYRDHDL